jgi:hypothetical protein
MWASFSALIMQVALPGFIQHAGKLIPRNRILLFAVAFVIVTLVDRVFSRIFWRLDIFGFRRPFISLHLSGEEELLRRR